MAVMSKLFDNAIDRYEKLGLNKHKLSAGLAGLVAAAYIAHSTYPHVVRLIGGQQKATVGSSDTSLSASDDEQFETDSDEYDANDVCNDETPDRTINNNTPIDIGKNGQSDIDNKPLGNGDIHDVETRLALSTKRKKKHTKVIKQQIKQAEKLLAAANKERNEAVGLEVAGMLKSHANRIGLNVAFLFQLKRLLDIMIPKLWCRETTILGVHTMCLLSRTFLSFYVASIEGSIVKFIVRKDFRQFLIGLLKWFGIAIPATFINSMIRYLENKLALSFR